MVAIPKQKPIKQLAFNFFNHYLLEIEEVEEIVNLKRLTKWREKDAKSDS